MELARLRIWAHRWGVQEIRIEDKYAVLHYTSREKIARLVKHSQGKLRVADGSSAYLPLSVGVGDAVGVFAEIKSLLRPEERAA